MIIKRKIDSFLEEWKSREGHQPLIIKGARQVGKTFSIEHFSKYYKHFININFVLEPKYNTIFDDGYDVESIIKNITLLSPGNVVEPETTLIFFDEMQHQPATATALKSFAIDGRFDVICSGSLMGINYHEIESNSVGYKEDYTMHSLDFEEFLWAKGYGDEFVESCYQKMLNITPLSTTEMAILSSLFRDYMITGGMPAVVKTYLANGNFTNILRMQQQLLLDYEEDISKYALGLDKGKVKNVYRHIPIFLAKQNKKYQISKIEKNARNRDYIGIVEWLGDAGIANVCYCLEHASLPLKGNYVANNYKLYFHDTGMLIASLDEESQEDLRSNRNFNTYKGAIYENVVSEALVKQHYGLYFYRNEKSTVEMDFFIRDVESLIPIEVKAEDGATSSLKKLIDDDEHYPDIKYGIKLGNKNIGFNGKFYTFPYFLTFLLRRFVKDRGK
ncbi:MAG: ATP-binding protein [Bacteroidaceae bacterium]|nr:ATP-binding protein [Bacteroidaceae bacterium]